MRKLIPFLIVGALSLTACGGGGGEATTPEATDRTYDTSKIEKVDAIASLLPESIRSKGKLVIGASVDYAPAEFLADDLKTPIGYDVDLGKALGRVLGVETTVENAEFASILPAIGTKYDLGISSFTITDERLQSANMVAYITVGSSFGVIKNNPAKVDPDNLCGRTIGVQTGTYQHEEADTMAARCKADGKGTLTVLPYAKQSDVTTNLVGGKIDAMYADSTITQYSVKLTDGAIGELGGVRESAPQGVVVAKDDVALTTAVQKGLQHLMDKGIWKDIASNWGVDAAIMNEALLNPKA